VSAINAFIEGSNPSGLVVCCRLLEYQWLPERLKLNGPIAMYAQGMTVREIQRFLEEQYKVEVSADLISTVTDSVLEVRPGVAEPAAGANVCGGVLRRLESQNSRRRNGQK
jgi:hypothetical protein